MGTTNAQQTLDDLRGDLLSVKMLGLKADGVTDNFPALNIALAATATAKSPILHWPVGTYLMKVPATKIATVPTNLQMVGVFGAQVVWEEYSTTITNNIGAGTQTAVVGSMLDIPNGAILSVDTGANQENVTVLAVSTNSFTASFAKSHVSGAVVINTGAKCLFALTGDNSGLRDLPIQSRLSVSPANQNGVDFVQIGANNITIKNCHFNGQRDGGFQNTNGIQFVGNANGVEISGCIFEQLWYGFYRSSANVNTHQNIRVIDNRFYRNFGDDANFNCPGNPSGEFSITVAGNNFSDNQSNTPVGGFGTSFANCTSATITGNTYYNYQREAIHVELSNFITIADNTLTNVGMTDFSAIHIIDASDSLSITGNVVNCATNTVADFGIDIQPGGGSTSLQTIISDNIVNVSSTMTGILLNSSINLAVQGNIVTGPGIVSTGVYTGGTNLGIDIGGVSQASITGNLVQGFGSGIGSTATNIQVGDLSVIANNEVYSCNIGLALKGCGRLLIAQNLISNCVSPTAFGATMVAPEVCSFIGNVAVGCTNRIDFYDNMGSTNSLIALNSDDVSGNNVGVVELNEGYGGVSGFPGNLVIGAGATSGPRAGSISWGENSGFKLEFGTPIAGVFTPTVYVDDFGNLIYVGTNPSGGIVSYQIGKFTTWVGAGAASPLGSENFTTGFGGAVIQGPLKLPNVVTTLPLFDTGPGNAVQGGLINLATMVTGTLPVGNGGTGDTGFSTVGFVTTPGGSGALGSLAYGISGTINTVASFTSVTVVTGVSINFTAQTYSTTNDTVVETLTLTAHTVTDGLITS